MPTNWKNFQYLKAILKHTVACAKLEYHSKRTLFLSKANNRWAMHQLFASPFLSLSAPCIFVIVCGPHSSWSFSTLLLVMRGNLNFDLLHSFRRVAWRLRARKTSLQSQMPSLTLCWRGCRGLHYRSWWNPCPSTKILGETFPDKFLKLINY